MSNLKQRIDFTSIQCPILKCSIGESKCPVPECPSAVSPPALGQRPQWLSFVGFAPKLFNRRPRRGGEGASSYSYFFSPRKTFPPVSRKGGGRYYSFFGPTMHGAQLYLPE
ncbi:hypothetical protein TNCV_4718861 [Trichonephila clavipes]|nr:hypothetical protein TNCV_4718861 [Trichonephila clavipes]